MFTFSSKRESYRSLPALRLVRELAPDLSLVTYWLRTALLARLDLGYGLPFFEGT